VIATYVISPWRNYDPISLPKMLVISSLGFSCLFLLLTNRALLSNVPRFVQIYLALFVFGLFLSFVFSGAPLNQQFWGSFGRNTGMLTYFSLTALLLGMISISSSQIIQKLVHIFVVTSIPMTIYCLLQILGKDPIAWSELSTFGTLGNVNFLSAYLGLITVACFSILIDASKQYLRILSLLLLVVDLPIILSTGSIQGFMIFIAGSGITLLIFLHKLPRLRFILFFTYFLGLVGIILTILGLRNSGPLARFLFQPSVVFRGDYIHAGYELTLSHPLFGVGLDSYGDWYRQARGEISTLRTGPDRVSNTAHNIFLDISSTAGLLAGLSYILLVIVTGVYAFRLLRVAKTFHGIEAALISTWLAYQIQALISINQIGVGVWGWIFSGAIIGLGSRKEDEDGKKPMAPKALRGKMLSPTNSLIAISGFMLGLLLAIPPIRADMAFRAAQTSGSLDEMRAAALSMGGTAWHLNLSLDLAIKNKYEQFASETAETLVSKYPRDFFGWRVIQTSPLTSPARSDEAARVVRSLDPFNDSIG
jgi:hypothetical protein